MFCENGGAQGEDELQTDPQSLHTYHCSKKLCKLSCVDSTNTCNNTSASSSRFPLSYWTKMTEQFRQQLYFVRSRVIRGVRVVPSGSAERCAMSSLWVSVLQPPAPAFLFLCSAFFVTDREDTSWSHLIVGLPQCSAGWDRFGKTNKEQKVRTKEPKVYLSYRNYVFDQLSVWTSNLTKITVFYSHFLRHVC